MLDQAQVTTPRLTVLVLCVVIIFAGIFSVPDPDDVNAVDASRRDTVPAAAAEQSSEVTAPRVDGEASPGVSEDSVLLEQASTGEGQEKVVEPGDQSELSDTQAASELAPSEKPEIVTARGSVTSERILLKLHFESQVDDVTESELAEFALGVLGSPDGWVRAGFTFESDSSSNLKVLLVEPNEADSLCLPLRTRGQYSCQNGNRVVINAERWRKAVPFWDSDGLDLYRRYLINHEIGHLIGQFHPTGGRCPNGSGPAAVMEQQTIDLHSCEGNGTPRDWEIEYAMRRPVAIGPLPGDTEDRPNREPMLDTEPEVRSEPGPEATEGESLTFE